MSQIIKDFGLNATFFDLLGLFFCFHWLMSWLFFEPFIKVNALRQNRTGVRSDEAAKLLSEAKKIVEQASAHLKHFQLEKSTLLQAELEDFKKQQNKILLVAQENAKHEIHETIAVISKKKHDIWHSLHKEIVGIAEIVTKKLLGVP